MKKVGLFVVFAHFQDFLHQFCHIKSYPSIDETKFQALELSTLTGTQVLLLVASETGHIYAYSTHKFRPIIETDQGKEYLHNCLNSTDGMYIFYGFLVLHSNFHLL
jgi:hypothetical protein